MTSAPGLCLFQADVEIGTAEGLCLLQADVEMGTAEGLCLLQADVEMGTAEGLCLFQTDVEMGTAEGLCLFQADVEMGTAEGLCVSTIRSRSLRWSAELRACVKEKVAVLGPPSLIVPTVSVDVKQQSNRHSSGACGRKGERPVPSVPNSPYGLCGWDGVVSLDSTELSAFTARGCLP